MTPILLDYILTLTKEHILVNTVQYWVYLFWHDSTYYSYVNTSFPHPFTINLSIKMNRRDSESRDNWIPPNRIARTGLAEWDPIECIFLIQLDPPPTYSEATSPQYCRYALPGPITWKPRAEPGIVVYHLLKFACCQFNFKPYSLLMANYSARMKLEEKRGNYVCDVVIRTSCSWHCYFVHVRLAWLGLGDCCNARSSRLIKFIWEHCLPNW